MTTFYRNVIKSTFHDFYLVFGGRLLFAEDNFLCKRSHIICQNTCLKPREKNYFMFEHRKSRHYANHLLIVFPKNTYIHATAVTTTVNE